MAGKSVSIVILAILPISLSMQMNGAPGVSSKVEAPHNMMLTALKSNADSAAEMGRVFERSDEQHRKSMDEISKTMTQPKALEVLQKSQFANSSTLNRMASLLTGTKNLRKTSSADDGFGGLDGARKLLNDMLYEVMTTYDAEIAKCTDYYSKQCALMEVARGQISAANYIAATARGLILDSQATINHCEISIPETKLELKNHERKCESEKASMNDKLKIIMDDIAIMTMILELSDCDAKLLQMNKLAMLKCKDQCTNKDYLTFNHKGLEQHLRQLKSPGMQELMSKTFADLFNDAEPEASVQLVQVEGSEYMEAVRNKTEQDQATAATAQAPKKTKYKNKILPRTEVPSNPCTDPDAGAPSAADKRAAKCTLKKSPRCYNLQGRFLQIQAGIADSRDALLDDIAKTEQSCKETTRLLEASIGSDSSLLISSQTKLSQAMEKENSAGESGRKVNEENELYDADLQKQMKTCSKNYIDYETDICAFRKIRGDVFKKLKPGHTGFFQDCEVSPWTPEECNEKCAGGVQNLTRSVLSHPNGGSKCLPLKSEKKCNRSPCPVNCVLKEWGGWSRCSSKCGGGQSQRVRDVKQAEQHDGTPCDATVQVKQCNVEACEKDCVLHEWTKWTVCSKDCDGGTIRRERMIKEPVEGAGECADKWSPSRLQYKPCNQHRCQVPNGAEVMKCNKKMDVMLVIDGTPKSGKKGFNREIDAANLFVDAFQGDGVTAKPSFSVIHYTGPRTWSGVSKCTGKNSVEVDMETVCKITLAEHFSTDLTDVKNTISKLEYQPGSKLLSLALMTAQFEFALGDKNSQTVVVVFMDGQPLSYRKTLLASRAIRKKARLLWVVLTKFAPLADIKKWASRRWQENVVTVDTPEELASADTGTHIVANICPKTSPKLSMPALG